MDKKVKHEPHPDYRPTSSKVPYFMQMEDGTMVGSSQPPDVAEEIIHSAAKVEEIEDAPDGYDLQVTTAYGHMYRYRGADFEKAEQ